MVDAPAVRLIVVFSDPCSTIASPLPVSKLPTDADNELPNPCLAGDELTTSMTPPSFRPYSAGYPPVMIVIECTSSAPGSGAKTGDRLSVIGSPSTTNCV